MNSEQKLAILNMDDILVRYSELVVKYDPLERSPMMNFPTTAPFKSEHEVVHVEAVP